MRIAPPGGQARQHELDERERCEHVDARRHVLERVERVVGQRGLRARAEHAGVVDEQVDAGPAASTSALAVVGVGDVAGDGDHVAEVAELARRRRARRLRGRRRPGASRRAARAAVEREAEAAGGSGDDGGGHATDARLGAVAVAMAIGLRTPDQTRPHGVQRRLRAVGDAELGQHVADVRLDRLLGDPELERDPLVGAARGRSARSTSRSRGVRLSGVGAPARRAIASTQPRGDARVQQRLAGVGGADGARQLLRLRRS